MNKKVICGQCNETFENKTAYLDHVCTKYGAKPVDPESMGEGFRAIQKAAQKRGESRNKN